MVGWGRGGEGLGEGCGGGGWGYVVGMVSVGEKGGGSARYEKDCKGRRRMGRSKTRSVGESSIGRRYGRYPSEMTPS